MSVKYIDIDRYIFVSLRTASGRPGGLHSRLQIPCHPVGEGVRPGPCDQQTRAVVCLPWDFWRPVCTGGPNYSPSCCFAMWQPGDPSSAAEAGNGTCEHASMCIFSCFSCWQLDSSALKWAKFHYMLIQRAFLPTMADDMLAVAQQALGPVRWYGKSKTEKRKHFYIWNALVED